MDFRGMFINEFSCFLRRQKSPQGNRKAKGLRIEKETDAGHGRHMP
jgi:hypothetical protein